MSRTRTRRRTASAGARAFRNRATWELTLARRFREAMPGAEAPRGLRSPPAVECGDVVAPDFRVNATVDRRTRVRAALRQAIADAPAGEWPVAICKDDRRAPFVAMRLDDFMDLLAEWWAWRQS